VPPTLSSEPRTLEWGRFMYQFKEEVNVTQYFHFDKRWIENMNWAALPSPSKSILPVIAMEVALKRNPSPKQTELAALSGLSLKSVIEGNKGMKMFPDFEMLDCVNRWGKRTYEYRLEIPTKQDKNTFFFHRCIIDGGNWSELKPASQALYPVMRYYGRFDKDIYANETVSDEDFDTIYKDRKWDICKADIKSLATFAHISRASVFNAFGDLERNFLIERMSSTDGWRVFRIPSQRRQPNYLNEKIVRRFSYEKDE
jgi:hypothetical protein